MEKWCVFPKPQSSDTKNGIYNIKWLMHVALLLFSHSGVSSSLQPHGLQPHGLQHTRLPCPSPSPRACSNSCPLSQWCHPTISSSVIPFSSCLQSFPASGSFPVSQFFALGGQSIGMSASSSGLSMNIHNAYKMGIWYSIYCYAVWFISLYSVTSNPVSVYISIYGSRGIWLQK